MKLLIRIYLIAVALHTITAFAELSTSDRIKKHREWLQQRGLIRPSKKSTLPDEIGNLKTPLGSDDRNANDVYPENEAVTTIRNLSTDTQIPTALLPTVAGRFRQVEAPTTTQTTSSTVESTTMRSLESNLSSTTTKSGDDASTSSTSKTLNTSSTARSMSSFSSANKRTTMSMDPTTAAPSTSTSAPKSKLRSYPRWSTWSPWSECSRTCGGGVMWQQRKCISKRPSTGRRYISNDCIGIYRRHHLCNDHPCPSTDIDFRHQQCAAFNDVDFQGARYNWEPYLKDDAECELNCKPLGMKYFATLNSTVVDGTMCFRPAEYYRFNYRGRAFCVGGVCKAIHGPGLIGGLVANSGTVACGGLICRSITGIFTRNPLPEDAYVHVATIPAGASNITITELKNSINLLVLRTMDQKYLFNGENTESQNGAYEAAGTVLDYRRIDGLQDSEGVTEWITCTGPIREMLELMVFSRDINPGVKYEYLLPIGSDTEDNEVSVESDVSLKAGDEELTSGRTLRKRKFNWKVVGFSPCSKSCGGGSQTPIIRCIRENPTRYFSQRRCSHADKPVLNENLLRCNTQPCPAFWRVDDWGECKCLQNEGVKEREVNCVQELANGIVIQVNSVACLDEEPVSKKPCDCPKVYRRRGHNRHKNVSGRLQNSIVGNSTLTNQKRVFFDKERAGVWLTSEWNNYCSAACGPGVEYRSIFCDRSKPNTDRCDLRITPDTIRPCEAEIDCVAGEWFAGPWSNCTGSCFNLTRVRPVICIQNQLIVDDEDCKADERPMSVQSCKLSETEYCIPKWHYSAWSECTKTCDSGTQRRSVRCLEFDEKENTLKDSTKCRYSKREPIYRSCNTHKCNEPRVDLIQNDIAPSCVDEFPNCHLVVKARLCSYDYYQQNCCYSCGSVPI